MLKTKDAENLIYDQLTNWLRWGRKRDWMPRGFICPVGFAYKSTDIHQATHDRPLPIFENAALKFEAVVINLPERHRKAFVMYVMGKAGQGARIVEVTSRDHAARILGVRKSRYHELVMESVNMVMLRLALRRGL